jgi:hypothetical protein
MFVYKGILTEIYGSDHFPSVSFIAKLNGERVMSSNDTWSMGV